jgi:cell wall-associated NlpC family hydrolase
MDILNRKCLSLLDKQKVINEGSRLIDVPFVRSQASVYGCDCVGFVWLCYRQLGEALAMPVNRMTETDVTISQNMLRLLEQAGFTKRQEEGVYGLADVLVFNYVQFPTHMGIVSREPTTKDDRPWLMHSSDHFGKVKEHPLSGEWLNRLNSVWYL